MSNKTATAPLLEPEKPATETKALTVQPTPDAIGMFERLAKDPTVDVDKLQKLIDLQKDIMRTNAEIAFNAAFVQMQKDIPAIKASREGDKWNFAALEDIVTIVRPILSKHCFTLSHKTEWPDAKTVRVIGILTHEQGHQRTSEFISVADSSGSKNAIQALGSTVSYGRRYTTKDLLCIVTEDEDDDGEKGGKEQPDAPKGFDDWWTDLQAAADNGWDTFKQAWNPESVKAFREYAATHEAKKLDNLRARARRITKERAS
jgi:hypothetical protein